MEGRDTVTSETAPINAPPRIARRHKTSTPIGGSASVALSTASILYVIDSPCLALPHCEQRTATTEALEHLAQQASTMHRCCICLSCRPNGAQMRFPFRIEASPCAASNFMQAVAFTRNVRGGTLARCALIWVALFSSVSGQPCISFIQRKEGWFARITTNV